MLDFLQHMMSVWNQRRTKNPRSAARGRRWMPRLEALEVRTLLAGEFTDLGALGIAGADRASVTWGDYDNDGDLDVLLTGRDAADTLASKVYRNDGNNTFTDINAGLTAVSLGSSEWGDYDNDGDLDILLVGRDASFDGVAKVYRNDGNSTFTDINAGLIGTTDPGAAAWGDFNNDGKLDIVLNSFKANSRGIPKFYQNTGNNTFTPIEVSLSGTSLESVACGDYDNDGDLDLILVTIANSPSQGLYRVSKIYRNNGDWTFTDINAGIPGVENAGIPGVEFGSVAWGDYDNDGDLDVLLTGRGEGLSLFTRIYRNSGNSTFTDINAGLAGALFGEAIWGDYDNDGDLDILNSGINGVFPVTVYRNNGNSTFTNINTGLTGARDSSVAWGDYDNDGDLDIILAGRDASDVRVTKVFRNNAVTANTPPAAPTGLTATVVSSTSLPLSWTAPTGDATPAAGLSYNLRVGTTPGGSDVFSTMANTVNGIRRIANAGPIQETSYTLKNLTPGLTYYWSVQAIDASFAGGAFAAEQSTNLAPVIGGAVANQTVDDGSTVYPFSTITVTDTDTQDMFTRITILNGVVRGDFFPSEGIKSWTRTVVGNDIIYSRYLSPQYNVGRAVQDSLRGFVFRTRANAIAPNTTEVTAFNIYVTDGVSSASNNQTTVIARSINNTPEITATPSLAMNDHETINPFAGVSVFDRDHQEMLARITIHNGLFRGDFTNAVSNGWTRSTFGNDIQYVRYFSPQANIGDVVQSAFRALVYQPRTNAIAPGTTELTDFISTVSDGIAPPALQTSGTRITVTSVNDPPVIAGTVANQTVDNSGTRAVFSTATVTDPDTQDLFVRVTIDNAVNRGDFTPASTTGWTRSMIGSDIVYARYFSPEANIGATAQSAVRALVFRPRANRPFWVTETTSISLFISDGIASTTDHSTSVVASGFA